MSLSVREMGRVVNEVNREKGMKSPKVRSPHTYEDTISGSRRRWRYYQAYYGVTVASFTSTVVTRSSSLLVLSRRLSPSDAPSYWHELPRRNIFNGMRTHIQSYLNAIFLWIMEASVSSNFDIYSENTRIAKRISSPTPRVKHQESCGRNMRDQCNAIKQHSILSLCWSYDWKIVIVNGL